MRNTLYPKVEVKQGWQEDHIGSHEQVPNMHESQSRCFSEQGPTLPTDHVLIDWQEPFTSSSKQRLCRVITTVSQAWGQSCLGEVRVL